MSTSREPVVPGRDADRTAQAQAILRRPERPAVLLAGVIIAVVFALRFLYDAARALDGAQALSTVLPSANVLERVVVQLVGLPEPSAGGSPALGVFLIVVAIAALGVLAFATDTLDAAVSSRVGMTVCLALLVAFDIMAMSSLGLQFQLLLSCLLCLVAASMLWAPPANRYGAAD